MKKIWKILLVAFLIRFVFSFITWHPDLNNHVDWGIRFWEYGPEKYYKANVWSFTWPNQPPGTIYIFAGIRKLFEFIFSLLWYINVHVPPFPSNWMFFFERSLYPSLLKLPSIISDCAISYLIYRLFETQKKQKIGIYAAILFLINPVIWYNSTIWGQTDSIINLFGLLSFVFLLEKKLAGAVLAMALCLYIKLSLVIFVPILLVFALRQKYSLPRWIFALGISVTLICLLTVPFSQGNPFTWLFYIYKDKVLSQQLQVITANAFNLWAGVAGIHERPQTVLLGPLQYAQWGHLFFGLTYLPALYLSFKKQNFKSGVWSLSIVAFSSFMLATNMHERYSYPLFPYFTILTVLYSAMLPLYVLVSTITFLNLYNFWWYPRFEPLVQILSVGNRLAPRVLGFLNFALYLAYYKSFLKRNFFKTT